MESYLYLGRVVIFYEQLFTPLALAVTFLKLRRPETTKP